MQWHKKQRCTTDDNCNCSLLQGLSAKLTERFRCTLRLVYMTLCYIDCWTKSKSICNGGIWIDLSWSDVSFVKKWLLVVVCSSLKLRFCDTSVTFPLKIIDSCHSLSRCLLSESSWRTLIYNLMDAYAIICFYNVCKSFKPRI